MSIAFPLAGEWTVGADGTEPGHELALDFMRLDQQLKATTRAAWRELLTAVPYAEHYGWGQPILSPFEGRVVLAVDGVAEHPQSYLRKVWAGIRFGLSPRQRRRLAALEASQSGDIRDLAGNHLVIESLAHPGVFVFLAHARQHSITVKVGEEVQAQQQVAQVGDSGQSTAPHLHLHLMSSSNPVARQLIPFRFLAYEALVDGEWRLQRDTLPTRNQRVRSVAA